MNDKADVLKKIDTVLKSEQLAYRTNGRSIGKLGTFNVGMQTPAITRSSGNQSLILPTPSSEHISSRSSATLLKLYSQLGTDGREIFKKAMYEVLAGPSQYQNQTYLVYHVLYRLDDMLTPIQLGLTTLKDDEPSHYGRGNLLAILSHILTYEYNRFNDNDLEQLSESLKWLPAGQDFRCLDKIIEIRMKLLEDELEDVNPAINADRDKVIDFWQTEFGSSEIKEQINQIESLFSEGTFSNTKLATCLGRVRVLLIDSLKRLSNRIAEERELPKLSDKPEDSEVINWFKQNGVLNAQEKKLIRAMYDLCSDEGAHASTTNKEYARIAKNVTYECIVMVIGLVPKQ